MAGGRGKEMPGWGDFKEDSEQFDLKGIKSKHLRQWREIANRLSMTESQVARMVLLLGTAVADLFSSEEGELIYRTEDGRELRDEELLKFFLKRLQEL